MSIQIENAGPVESLVVPTEPGSIIVIRGMNDAGKSESLKAIQRLLGGNEQIRRRYGTPDGVVEGLGVTVRLLSSARASGECEAVSLEGKLDIGDLIDPGLKDPVAADKARIKALLTVRGVKADLAQFADLVGGEEALTEIASDRTKAATDVVEMAASLKKDLETAARNAEDAAKTLESQARGKREVPAGLDLEAEADGGKLQDALEEAIVAETKIVERRDWAEQTKHEAEMARSALKKARESYAGPTGDEAAKQLEGIEEDLGAAREEVAAKRKALEAAMAEESRAETAYQIARETHKAAAQHEADLAWWEETIAKAADVEEISEGAVEAAGATVLKARRAIEEGALIRQARHAIETAKALQNASNNKAKQAERLRDAARGTTDVLAGLVSSGALVPVTDDKGQFRFGVKDEEAGQLKYYHDLGPGRQTAIAVMEVASSLRSQATIGLGLVVIPQPQWEGLDWENRRLVAEHVERLGLTVVTAEADKDPERSGGIRAERYVP